jgi:hypothetical protein
MEARHMVKIADAAGDADVIERCRRPTDRLDSCRPSVRARLALRPPAPA